MGTITRNFANNILSSGTFDATKLTGDIPSINLSTNAPAFNDNKIVNDLSTLGLRVHTQENLNASNTNSQFIDVFNDASGIDTTTDVVRDANEYISTFSIASDYTATIIGDAVRSDTQSKFGGYSLYIPGTRDTTGDAVTYNTSNNYDFSGDFTIEGWCRTSAGDTRLGICSRRERNQGSAGWFVNLYNGKIAIGYMDSSAGWLDNGGTGSDLMGTSDLRDGSWHHFAIVRESNVFAFYVDGTRESTTSAYTGTVVHDDAAWDLAMADNASNVEGTAGGGNSSTTFNGYLDDIRINNNAVYSGASYTVPTSALLPDANTLFYSSFDQATLADETGSGPAATGNFTGTTITAPSSVSEMGAVITYQDNAGTNALNTDIVLQLSADNGSNYTTATLTALPDFSSGIKMAKVNDLSIGTPGTQLKYKISFANQSSGSKEARIRGVSLNY